METIVCESRDMDLLLFLMLREDGEERKEVLSVLRVHGDGSSFSLLTATASLSSTIKTALKRERIRL